MYRRNEIYPQKDRVIFIITFHRIHLYNIRFIIVNYIHDFEIKLYTINVSTNTEIN